MSRILLVEDDSTMVSLLTTFLSMEGYQVAALDPSGENLLPQIVEQSPDILFMDVHLPKHNGLDILQGLRAHPAGTRIRVVMTSGMDLGERCLTLGANDFLMKPYMPDDLIAILKKQAI